MNGTVLAQYDGTNNIYFQYKNGVPIGFELNEVQYFYITNLSGDVMGITDSQGSLIAEYTYDEWGKLLNIETAEENNEEQLAIAETNPLRYRGYYYDNETGLYYLQSKYYNPEICRYISAGSFENLDTSNELNSNAYLYCWNNSVAFSETEGAETEVSIDPEKLFAFLKNAGSFIKERLQENYEDLKSRFNAFAEKVKFYFYNPDVLINQTLSFFLGREVNIRFRFIELIKEQLKANSEKTENSNSEEEYGVAPYYIISDDEKTSDRIEAVFKGWVIGFEILPITELFEAIIKVFNPLFDYNSWYTKLSSSLQDYFDEILLSCVTAINTVISYFTDDILEHIADIFSNWALDSLTDKLINEKGNSLLDMFDLFGSVRENFNQNNSVDYSFIATFIDIGSFVVSINFPQAAILSDAVADITKLTVSNVDNGKLWG